MQNGAAVPGGRRYSSPYGGEGPPPPHGRTSVIESHGMIPMGDTRATVDDIVRAFETAWARDGSADLAHLLPGPADPLYPEALRELVRVDLEFGWQHGRPRPLVEYLERYP